MDSIRIKIDLYRGALLLLIMGFTLMFTLLSFRYHDGMRTHKADLGQISQAVWNSGQGRFVEMTDNGFVATRMTDHVEPILALISPILWLWRDVRALLLLQVLAAAAGAWILYEFAILRFKRINQETNFPKLLALGFAAAFLLSPPLQEGLLTEFHAAPLAVPLVLWAFWAVESRRWWQFVVALILVASVKEEMALLAAGLGVWGCYQVISSKSMRRSKSKVLAGLMGLTVLALGWFYVATFVIVPANAPLVYDSAESIYFQRYGALGSSPVDILTSFVTRPGLVWEIATEPLRVRYLILLLYGFGFLSLFGIEVVLIALPLLFANLFSEFWPQYYGEFHYSAPLVPYFAVAAVVGSSRILWFLKNRSAWLKVPFRPHVMNGLFTLLAVMSLRLYTEEGRGYLGGRYEPVSVSAHHRLLDHFVGAVPPDAALTATAAVHPHMALRRYIYQFPLGLPELVDDSEQDRVGRADWALIDVTTNTDMAAGDVKAAVDTMLAGEWGVVGGIDGFLLLNRGWAKKQIPAEFYNFARLHESLAHEFGIAGAPPTTTQPLTTLGTTTEDWARWRLTKASTVWHVGAEYNHATTPPTFEIRKPGGERVYVPSMAPPPALVWYPPEIWEDNVVVRVTTPWLALPPDWAMITPAGIYPYQHRANGSSDPIYATYSNSREFIEGSIRTLEAKAEKAEAVFDAGDLSVTGGLPVETWPGATLDLHLTWQGSAWPNEHTVFVHVRKDGQNIVQSDGLPRWFVEHPLDELTRQKNVNDWRQLAIPLEGLSVDDSLKVVVGLYNWSTGERLARSDGQGNEVLIGTVRVVEPPLVDLACAMNVEACDSMEK